MKHNADTNTQETSVWNEPILSSFSELDYNTYLLVLRVLNEIQPRSLV